MRYVFTRSKGNHKQPRQTCRSLVHFMLVLIVLGIMSGCGGGGGGGGGGGDGGSPDASPIFNGTFRGDVTTTQGGQDFVDTLTITLTVGSPLSGTFSTSDGRTGTISGDAVDNSATFTGTSEGDCPGTITDGSAMLTDNNTLSFETSGSDCDGPFSSTGTLTRATNAPPMADAGPNQAVSTGTLVTLDGSGSSDVDLGDQLTFDWAFIDMPDGSTATLSDSTVVNPTFAPEVDGAYVVSLIVNDGTEDSLSDDRVTITASTSPPGPGDTLPLGTTVTITMDGEYQLPAGATRITTRCMGEVSVTIPGSQNPGPNTCSSSDGSNSQTNFVTGATSVIYAFGAGASAGVTVN